MKLTVEKIRLNELEAFTKSPRYQRFEYVPVSTNRVHSYLHNPHALPGDLVLYLGFIEDQLVAFRSLFADVAYSDNKSIRFGWCSGNWVHPDYRRKGFSELLLKEAYSDWNQKLMFTNYAPNSELLYLKTGWFKPVHHFEGVRAYLFPKTRKLISDSNRNLFTRTFYSLIDFGIQIISGIRLMVFKKLSAGKYSFEIIGQPDEACCAFLVQNPPEHVFHRYEKELKWIFSYPWITNSGEEEIQKYPFTQFSKEFQYQTVKIYSENKPEGFCIFSVREKHLKTLYFACDDRVYSELANFLKHYSKKHKIEVVSIYKKELATQLLQRKFPFLRVKKYGQKIYSTFELPENQKPVFQDGDGDVIFT